MANEGVNILDGSTIGQKVQEGVTNSITNAVLGFFGGLLATATDMAFWVAIIAIPLLFTETGQNFLKSIVGDEMFGTVMDYRNGAMAWLGSNGIGRTIDGILNAIGLGTPLQNAAGNYLNKMTEAEFVQQTGLPADAAKVLYPQRVALANKGITSAAEALKPENAKFLLETFSTNDLIKLFDSLKSGGTAEQKQQTEAAIKTLLANQDVLKILNDRHPSLILKLMGDAAQQGQGTPASVAPTPNTAVPSVAGNNAAPTPTQPQGAAASPHAANTNLLEQLRLLSSSAEGLRTLSTIASSASNQQIAALGLTREQLQSAIADMQANTPKGQAYRTLLASDALPILAPILPQLQSNPSLSSAFAALRDPKVREQLGKPEIVAAIAQLAPKNTATDFLFTPVRNTNGTISYPNVEQVQKLAAFVDSGNSQQLAQRTAAINALGPILSTGQLPAAGSPERAALQTFASDESNRTQLLSFLRNTDISTLSPDQARLANVLRGQHGEGILKVLADPEAVKWAEAQMNPAPTPAAAPEQKSIMDKVSDWVQRNMPTAVTSALAGQQGAPKVVQENMDAVLALKEALHPPVPVATPQTPAQAAPARSSSLETDPDIAKQVAAITSDVRSAGIVNGTTAIGSPNVAALAGLPQQPREAVQLAG